MKLKDSDFNPEQKMTNVYSVPENLIPEATKQTMMELQSTEFKTTAYKQMVDNFCDTLCVAEDMFTEKEIATGFVEALTEQRQFYKEKEKFYSNLLVTIKFMLNEK